MATGASDFTPAWWCRNPHCQTLWPRLTGYRPAVALRRERLELPDGDFVDLDWTGRDTGPIVLILHGLEGSSRSPYARGLLAAVHARGWRGVVMHFRGCSGTPNRLARSYHSGDTGDIAHCVQHLREREPGTPIAAAGYSLGGNALLKWLGEDGGTPLAAAVAVSVPYRLEISADRIHRGFSRLYERYFLRTLLPKIHAKLARHPRLPIDTARLATIRSLREFDDAVTGPLHGFRDADDYYRRASCHPCLGGIRVPSLLLHAGDDPFMTPAVIPDPGGLPPPVTLECFSHGGHVGFVCGRWPGGASYWLERRIVDYLAPLLARRAPGGRERRPASPDQSDGPGPRSLASSARVRC